VSLLRRLFKHEDIGWIELEEKFTRYFVFRSRFFNVFLHQMSSPIMPPQCHDHPWSFVTLILRKGYWESTDGITGTFRFPGTVLFRRAEFAHTVKTLRGETAWTLVLTGPVRRKWQNLECR